MISPDTIELILEGKSIYNQQIKLLIESCILNNSFNGSVFYNSSSILYHCSLIGLDLEMLSSMNYYNKIFNNSYNISEYFPVQKYMTLGFTKASGHKSWVIQYYFDLYIKLLVQTNNFDPLELGKRVIILPNNFPENFEGIEQMLKPLIKDDINLNDVDLSNMTLEEKTSFMEQNRLFFNEDNYLEQKPIDISFLTNKKLRIYYEEYNSAINIDSNNPRLYTRGRFLVNFYIYLNDYIKEGLVERYNSKNTVSSNTLNMFLGQQIEYILKYYDVRYMDNDCPICPVTSRLFTHGSVFDIKFYTNSLNSYYKPELHYFSNENNGVRFNLYLYEGTNNKIYIIIVLLDTDYVNFIKYIESHSHIFNLFIHSKDFK